APRTGGERGLWLNRATSDTPDKWRLATQPDPCPIPPAMAVDGQKRPSAAVTDSEHRSRAAATLEGALIPPAFRFCAPALEFTRVENKIGTFIHPHSGPNRCRRSPPICN